MNASKPAPPKPAGPGPRPAGPTHPAPAGPPRRYAADDLLFAAVDAVLADLTTPARQHLSIAAAVAGGPVQPPAGQPPLSGGAFRLPPTPTVPSFDGGPARCGYGCTRKEPCGVASSHWWSAYPFGVPIRP